MDNKERKTKLEEALAKQDLFTVKEVKDVNHKPHPYCITSKHITGKYMYLGKVQIEALEADGTAHCGMRIALDGSWSTKRDKKHTDTCHIPYAEHTSDRVLFLQHLRNGTLKEANDVFAAIQELLVSLNVDGIAMIDTKEKYRCK